MDMVPAIWKSLPIDILEMIFLWFPLSMIIHLKMVCKGWSHIVFEHNFISQWKHNQMKEYGVLVGFGPSCRQRFVGYYISQLGNRSSLSMPLLNIHYKMELMCGSIVAVLSASILYQKRNYYIINPFTKTCTFVGSLGLGDWGFFTLLRDVQQQKYHWASLKHVYA